MSRALRIQFEGAYYHVTCRGNDRRNIVRDERDRHTFLRRLEQSLDFYGVRLLSYVIMDNHFHFLIQTLKANLAEFMRHFNVSYTGAFNHRHGRSGHLYQGRYHAVVIERDSYLLELSRYIHLNPARVKDEVGEKLATLQTFPWSSYKGYVSARQRKPFLDYCDILDFFGGDNQEGRRRYAAFVREGITEDIPNPLKEAVGGIILGCQEFADAIRSHYLEKPAREQPAVRALSGVKPLNQVIAAVAEVLALPQWRLLQRGRMTWERGLLMEALHRYCALTQSEIGQLVGNIDYSTVSLNRKRFIDGLPKNEQSRIAFAKLKNLLEMGSNL
ncbi:MAG: transposase [Candidatus Abyssubacteria bacterium]